jgi:hypothetical protein
MELNLFTGQLVDKVLINLISQKELYKVGMMIENSRFTIPLQKIKKQKVMKYWNLNYSQTPIALNKLQVKQSRFKIRLKSQAIKSIQQKKF